MKKLIFALAMVAAIMTGIFSFSVSAERLTSLPLTMLTTNYGNEVHYTLEDCDIYTYIYDDQELYTKTLCVNLSGALQNADEMEFAFYLYDAAGNHIGTEYDFISKDEDYTEDNEIYSYSEFTVPDITASVEIGARYPYSWSHTYYYCNYINVYSDDGRSLAISDLLVDVYENVGWHGPVTMYALDGREIDVPYNQVQAYQNVGWYLWEDYVYHSFLHSYNDCLKVNDYATAFDELDWALGELYNTAYAKELYERKTKLMDAWRKKINGPLAPELNYAYEGEATIWFRNVSYKDIKAFKVQFDCFNVFNNKLSHTQYYDITNTQLSSGDGNYVNFEGLPYSTDHLENIKVIQVVYSDGTIWYR